MCNKTEIMRKILVIVSFVVTFNCFSQINTFYVEPIQTDSNYNGGQDGHLVVRNTTTNNNKLFLFLGGTVTTTSIYQGISEFVGNLGYDVINLSYLNNIPVTVLSDNTDPLAYNEYRQEICYGTQSSPFVNVDTLNSIYTRTVKLLNYLNTNYPSENWNQYLQNSTTLNWSKIVVGGHSQGSGHACYFGKFETPERVLMFSGPNDYSDYFSSPADWLGNTGNTTMNKHFSYLHLYDNQVDYSKQLNNLQTLGLYPLYDSVPVESVGSPYNNSHCLYMESTSGIIRPHSKTIAVNDLNVSVWTYMLTTDVSLSNEDIPDKSLVSIYPNPTKGMLYLSGDISKLRTVEIYSITGQHVMTVKDNFKTIDISNLDSALYFVKLNTTEATGTFKIIRE